MQTSKIEMGTTWAVWVDGRQVYAGSRELCEVVASNHNATRGGFTAGVATVAYLGD